MLIYCRLIVLVAPFKSKWNSLKNQDIVIVVAHGSYNKLSYISPSNIQKLKKISCKLLILLGCNNGHYDYTNLNIAYEFAKKVTGVVVASDGTVLIDMKKNKLKITSVTDKDYLDLCRVRTRPNKGWLIYQYINKNSYVWTTPYKNLDFKQFIAYLKMIKKF